MKKVQFYQQQYSKGSYSRNFQTEQQQQHVSIESEHAPVECEHVNQWPNAEESFEFKAFAITECI